jgi:hypothetical protein
MQAATIDCRLTAVCCRAGLLQIRSRPSQPVLLSDDTCLCAELYIWHVLLYLSVWHVLPICLFTAVMRLLVCCCALYMGGMPPPQQQFGMRRYSYLDVTSGICDVSRHTWSGQGRVLADAVACTCCGYC